MAHCLLGSDTVEQLFSGKLRRPEADIDRVVRGQSATVGRFIGVLFGVINSASALAAAAVYTGQCAICPLRNERLARCAAAEARTPSSAEAFGRFLVRIHSSQLFM